MRIVHRLSTISHCTGQIRIFTASRPPVEVECVAHTNKWILPLSFILPSIHEHPPVTFFNKMCTYIGVLWKPICSISSPISLWQRKNLAQQYLTANVVPCGSSVPGNEIRDCAFLVRIPNSTQFHARPMAFTE